MDPTRNVGFTDDTPLSSFFSRPVKIFEQEWEVTSSFSARFNPWTLFWENPRNLEKIRNYFLLKCNLHVKVLVNGNGFYYGRAICAYEPLAAFDNTSPAYVKRPTSYSISDLVRLSQRMHFYINPSASQGGSLELPFFYPKNALEIPAKEWNEMGDIVILSMSELQHANGGLEPVNISVFAWAENVSISIPTSNVPEMNHPEMDEHNMNVISRPASNVARIAGSLSNVPMIGPFAKATEMGASALASIAKIFGYSSPVDLERSTMVPLARSTMAVTDVKYDTNKLTFDSKQELTIDPVTTGIRGDDELPIASIAGRESFITRFDWNEEDGPGTTIFQIRVDPFSYIAYSTLEGIEYHLTASAAAVLPFKYWRGTLRYRFQVVSSDYHKGRLRLVYNPKEGNIDPEFNTHYTTIHDIASDKDFTIDIGWAQNTPYREHLRHNDTLFSRSHTAALGSIANKTNGTLSVVVLNNLTTPGTVSANIRVNIFVSALDDFEVAEPDAYLTDFTFRANVPESAFNIPEMDMGADAECCENVIADPPTIDTMADVLIDTPDTTKLFFGEVIGSFRQLIKRTCLHEVLRVQPSAVMTLFRMQRAMFPETPGYYNGTSLTNSMTLSYTDGTTVVPCKMTYIKYVSRLFLGWRGSIRWTVDTSHLNTKGNFYDLNSSTVTLSRAGTGPRVQNYYSLPFDGSTEKHNIGPNILNVVGEQTVFGAFVGNNRVNPLMSIEVPYYSIKRFEYCAEDYDFDLSVPYETWVLSTTMPGKQEGVDDITMTTYCSAGEDLNFFFFNGLPPMYYQANLPYDPGE